MRELAAFIDLNTYRMTDAILADIYTYANNYDNTCYHFYNYSATLHKSLHLKSKNISPVSSRRRVQIDIRIICDAIEYACRNNGGNILLLCGTIDAEPLFSKLKELKSNITFATMQKVNVGATDYLTLTRQVDFQTVANRNIDSVKPKTLVTTALNPSDMQVAAIDDYELQLQELNSLINKLKF